ncbi:hypothetical protein GF323_04425 [Candidatus Woesearchaeota archaeon]|nr:hypothetical protein [Candidatus Woesearchaeota archaeon]
MKAKLNLEGIFLVVFFFFLLWAGLAALWDHRINHDFPYAYMASDGFQHQVRADSIKQMGNYRYEAPYIAGGFKDAIGFYPPLMYHLDVIMSNLSGIEIYDISYFLVFVFLGFGSLTFYFIIRKFNKNIALISLPLSLLLFSKGPGIGPYALITWGSWPLIFGHFFLICFFWYFQNMNIKHSWIFLGIFLSALALQHQSELFFVFVFIGIILIFWLIRKDLSFDKIRSMAFGGILFIILSIYYLIIFRFTLMESQKVNFFEVVKTTTTDQTLYFSNFGIIGFLIIGGIILSLFLIKKKHPMPMMVSFFMFLVGYGNYIGFNRHAFKTRCLWPIYLSVFMAISLFYLIKLIVKRWKIYYSISVAIILAVILSGIIKIPYIPHSQRFTSPGIMDRHHWDALVWVRHNTPQDTKILFLYGDPYNQNALLRNTFRVPYMVKTKAEILPNIENRTIKRNMLINLLGDHHGVYYAYRKSLFDYGYHAKEMGDDYFYNKKRDICSFDYIIFDKASMQPVLAQYNLLIANKLLNNSNIKIAYENQIVAVLNNENPGGDCIENQTSF